MGGSVAVVVHHASVCVVYVFAGHIWITACVGRCWLVCALNNGRQFITFVY